MSMQGNIAVEGEMKNFLTFLDEIKIFSSEHQLKLIKQHVEDIKRSAQGGWL